MGLNIKKASVVYPSADGRPPVEALREIDLDIVDDDFVVALGASGCGKSTLLSLIAGFLSPSSGEILLDGASVQGPGADRAVVFQKHALLPWLNVIDNVAFGLKLQGIPEARRYEVARGYIKLLGLGDFEKSRVYNLSGGMQQRVGIARALTCDPKVLLMDEPLGALDALTREKAQELILNVWHTTEKSVGAVHGHQAHRHVAAPRPHRAPLRPAVLAPVPFWRPRARGQGQPRIHRDPRGCAEDHLLRRGGASMTDSPLPETAAKKKTASSFLKARATKPGETYGVPGQGDTLWLSILSILGIIFVWWFVTFMGWVKPLFLPSPVAVLNKFIQVWNEGFTNTPFLEHVGVSAARVFGAFLLACLIGIPLGIAMGMNPIARGIFDPPIEFYRPIPPLAYLPLMIIWFGIGETSKVLLIFLSVLAPVTLGARSGVKSAAIEQIHAAYSFGASRWQVMRHVIMPSALPEILTAMRIGIGFGWTTLVAAEMVAATEGLGYMVLSASQFLQTSTVIMGIIVIAIIAYSFDMLMRFIERKVVPWKGRM